MWRFISPTDSAAGRHAGRRRRAEIRRPPARSSAKRPRPIPAMPPGDYRAGRSGCRTHSCRRSCRYSWVRAATPSATTCAAAQLLNFVGIVETDDGLGESWTEIPMGICSRRITKAGIRRSRPSSTPPTSDQCYRWSLHNRPPICELEHEARRRSSAIPRMRPCPIWRRAPRWRSRTARCWRARSGRKAISPRGCRLYQRNRVDRTARIVEQSTQNRRLFHLPSKGGDPRRIFQAQRRRRSQSLALFLQPAHGTAGVTVIASEAKQSSAASSPLDCFVASLLAMTGTTGSIPGQLLRAACRAIPEVMPRPDSRGCGRPRGHCRSARIPV